MLTRAHARARSLDVVGKAVGRKVLLGYIYMGLKWKWEWDRNGNWDETV